MVRCSWVFPDGRPCRCPARHHRSLCRHHTPEALEERARRSALPPPELALETPPTRSEYASFWRGYHGAIRRSPESQFDEILSDIMDALDRGVLSHRSAGRLLATLVQRRRQLHQERLNQQLIRIAEQHRALRQSGMSAMGLHEILAPQVREMMGLESQNATR